MKVLLFIFGLLCFSLNISAQQREFPQDSGNAFSRLCGKAGTPNTVSPTLMNAVMVAACNEYVEGVADGIEYYGDFVKGHFDPDVPKAFCAPRSAESGQLVNVVLKYIHDNPKYAQLPTKVLIMGALVTSYPCPKK